MESKKASELILNDGKVYHLDLAPEHISDTIILVGDQYRVPIVSAYFSEIEHQIQKREFLCHTGWYNGKRLSVISTGIGTDNVDIVLNELDALVNFDLNNRTEKQEKSSLKMVRIGTCGALQSEIEPGDFILSTGSFGLDNVGHFYEIEKSNEENNILKALEAYIRFPDTLKPYFTFADEKLNSLLHGHERIHEGFTVTASGFYGPQGRNLRLPLRIPDLNDGLASFRYKDLSIMNLEMESSAIFALARGLGHEAATICVALANRPKGTFLNDYTDAMSALIEYVLEALTKST